MKHTTQHSPSVIHFVDDIYTGGRRHRQVPCKFTAKGRFALLPYSPEWLPVKIVAEGRYCHRSIELNPR